jgi:predicted kinase
MVPELVDARRTRFARTAPMPASRHVFLYGPPAAGKLTVARRLASQYGLKLLDNHLTADVAGRLFEFGTKPFVELVDRLRKELTLTAARHGIDVVSTFVYDHPTDRGYVDRVVAVVEAEGGTVAFVQLLPPPAVLQERVIQPSRAEAHKLRDPVALDQVLLRYDLRTPITPDDLSIDNSDLPPEDVAALIAAHAGLQPIAPEV